MSGVILELDPTSEDAANVSLVLVDNVTYFLLGEDWPSPPLKQSFAESVSTEGSVPVTFKHDNRSGQITLRVVGSTAAALQTAVNYIDKKVQKIIREGGTLKRTAPSGDVYFLDLLGGEQNVAFDKRFMTNNRAQVTISLGAKPYWRQAPITLSSHSETTLPCLIFIEPGASSSNPYKAAVVTDTPASYWRLAEPSGTTAADNQGVNTGTYVNSPTLGVVSPVSDIGDTAVTFNGTTQCVSVNDSASLDLADTFSLEAWIKRTATLGTNQTIISKGSGAYNMRMGTGNNLELVKSNTSIIVPSTTTITDTNWHHVVATKTGATCKLYIDAVDRTGVITNATCADNANHLRVGSDSNGADVAQEFFTGSIDEPAVYNTVLSAARVSAHYAARTGAAPDPTIKGDVPGLGKLVVTGVEAVDQSTLIWGIQSRYYSSSADAALFYEAEGRTALGGSATAAGPSGASGGGSNVMRSAALTTSYVSILGTQATGAGNHLSHVGDFQVWARVQTPNANAGAFSIALEWGQGDFLRITRNAATTFPVVTWNTTWRLVNLGQVSLTKVAQGTQRWEGRVIAKSTVAGDTVDVDCLYFVPITEGSGIAQGIFTTPAVSAFSGRDAFNQAGGALNGKTADVGGNWATSGSAAGDFATTGGGQLNRTAVSDVGGARFAALGATTFTNAGVGIDVRYGNVIADVGGPVARFADTNNFARLVVDGTDSNWDLELWIAGVPSVIGTLKIPTMVASVFYRAEMYLYANGTVIIRALDATGVELARKTLFDSRLATGGTLASGKSGIFDWKPNATASTRLYDNFAAWVAIPDAAVFATRQAEIRHDRVIRQDSSGSFWNPVSKYEGDYLFIPPAGREGRTARVFLKGCRNDPATAPDNGIDDITAQLVYTPRFVTLPE